MREIKFRVWNGERMEYNITAGKFGVFFVNPMTKGNGLDVKDSASITPFNTRYPDSTPLMQFTGLKDKNGKEIYEGDILHCHEWDSSDCGHRIVQTFKNAVVGFGQGNYYYYPKGNMQQPHQLLMYAYKPEIIGNIYEHPELLTHAQ